MSELIMYRESDLEDCTRIYTEAFNAPPLNFDFISKEKAERYLRDITKKPGFLGYVYQENGETAAFIFGNLDNYFQGVMFEVEELAVAPELHRGGVGSRVMGMLEAKLTMYGVSAVNLHTSRSLPAFDFYMKNGYDECNESVTLMKWLQ